MDEMDIRTPEEVNEEGFRNFIKRLLEAQNYDFMKEKVLFSRKTLERTLEEFCNITAEELDCDSCTIQLQIYDPKMMDEKLLNKLIYDHLFKTSKSYIKMRTNSFSKEEEEKLDNFLGKWLEIELSDKKGKSNPTGELNNFVEQRLTNEYKKKYKKHKFTGYLKEFKKSRINWLKSPLVFPYWAYGKGVAGTVAVNDTSPWDALFKDENNDLKYIDLFGGVSKTIFQENVARVRDNLSIRGTRNFRKLGVASMIVWNNTGWKYVFKSFYGIPIRIHSGGEVIGILKAENKWTYGKEKEEINEIKKLLNKKKTETVIKRIISKISKKFKECKKLDFLNVSFLSLAYLEKDLSSWEDIGNDNPNECTLDQLLFIPYPDYIINILRRIKEDLLSGNGGIKDPLVFLKEKVSPESKNLNFLKKLFSKKKILCDILKDFLAFYSNDEKKIQSKDLQDIIDLKISDKDYSPFQNMVFKILEEFEKKINEVKDMSIKSLKPKENERPPIQLFTRTLEEEKILWSFLGDEKDHKKLCENVFQLYNIFNDDIFKKSYGKKNGKTIDFPIVTDELKAILLEEFKLDIGLQEKPTNLPNFHFKVSLSSDAVKDVNKKPQSVDLYIVIPPTREEIHKNLVPNHELYEKVNKIWLAEKNNHKLADFFNHRKKLIDGSAKEPFKLEFRGEFVTYNNSLNVTDLLLDRLAARAQAFADALPIEEFRLEDTYKLKWAAFEIGKLIEREISYRANRHDDPMPLTAMEFYRIPISDLSFVDDLRTRRDDLKKAADNIDVYIKNTISQMEMTDSVKYFSRIKGYRSSLQRIGERFEGYVRGNIALWVFLLSFALNNDEKSRLEYFKENKKLKEKQGSNWDKVKHREDFLNNLEKFRVSIIESLNDQNFFDNFCKNNHLTQLYGDAKFDSPSFMDEKNLKDVYIAGKLADNVLELLNPGCNKEDIIENITKLDQLINIILKEDQLLNNFNELKNTLERVRGLFEDRTSITEKELHQNLNLVKDELKKLLEQKIENYKENLLKAFKRIINNLAIEGFKTIDFKDIDSEENQKRLNGLLLRNYSYFIRDSLSLLLQIINLLNTLNVVKDVDIKDFLDFKNFYRECIHLRAFLCSSFRELEGKDKYKLEKIFGLQEKPEEGGSWRKITEFINKYNTGAVFPDDNDNYLKLTPRSIYKRIRMLNNILNHQVPAAHLDWELGRFDLYGTRMNCLFKNQVFVLYEKIWNRGDPFFFYDPRAKSFKKYYSKKGKIDTDKYRQRWLCLRTNILAGEYNACQIAALIDPKTVEPEYWEYISSYNLKCAQYVLGQIFNEFEGTKAEKYRFYSWHRHLISECYRKWYRFKSALLKRETQNGDKEQKDTKWYGSFLFASVINLLMLMLNCIIDHKNNKDKKNLHAFNNDNLNKGIKNRHGFSEGTLGKIVEEMEKDIKPQNLFFEIINAFYWIINNGSSYSNCIKEGFMKAGLFSRKQFYCRCKGPKKTNIKKKGKMLIICDDNNTRKCDLYEMAIKIVRNIIGKGSPANFQESRDKEIFEKIKESLEKEKAFFTSLRVSDNIEGFQIPIFFFDENQKDSAGQSTLDNLQQICDYLQGKLRDGKGNGISVNYWDFIYITLKRIRREQRAYLFDKGEKEKNYAGLWIREKTEVLNRIKNYVLLFSEKGIVDDNNIDDESKRLFRGWNAHDLYYYIRSLIPMEIQVRTELANTFAVQYHEDIYKVQTPIGTEFPHAMLKGAGETLDRTDKELEIDYEDYILNVFHRIEEEEEKEKNF